MKPGVKILLTGLFVFYSLATMADAGFSIRRRTAPAQITFSGTTNLSGYRLLLVQYSYKGGDTLFKNPYISSRVTINDESDFVIQNGSKRWDESERYLHFALAKTDSAGTVTDTFTVYMEKWNYEMVINGVNDGKLQYTMKKSKAYYNYTVLDEDDSNTNNKTSRLIFIFCSLTGLVLLIVLFLQRRKI